MNKANVIMNQSVETNIALALDQLGRAREDIKKNDEKMEQRFSKLEDKMDSRDKLYASIGDHVELKETVSRQGTRIEVINNKLYWATGFSAAIATLISIFGSNISDFFKSN